MSNDTDSYIVIGGFFLGLAMGIYLDCSVGTDAMAKKYKEAGCCRMEINGEWKYMSCQSAANIGTIADLATIVPPDTKDKTIH